METHWIKGKLGQLVFRNDENWYTVALFKISEASEEISGEVAVVGEYPQPFAEEVYVFHGHWVVHPKYGKQFRVSRFNKEYPKERSAIIRYLSSDLFSGIGKKTAEKIVDELGENALDEIADDPSCLNRVSGLSDAKIKHIYESVISHKHLEQATIFLYEFGIGPGLALKIYQKYGVQSLEVIKSNPYQLIEDVEGVGFLRADQIGQALGIGFRAKERIRAAVFHCLHEAANSHGHTFLFMEELIQRARSLLDPSGEKMELSEIGEQVLELGEEGKLAVDENRCYLPSLYFAEWGFAGKIKKLAARDDSQSFPVAQVFKAIGKAEEELNIEYNESQKEAILTAVLSPIMILTGGPGTGKTTVIKGICRVFHELTGSESILLVAPTGRAAKRMAESVGLPATTIHRLLGWTGESFAYDADRPLTGDLIVIDEFSMVDIWLANQLFRALPDSIRVIIVGDPNQLPSVGPGMVLSDLLHSNKIKVVGLTSIYRQAEGSSIIQLAHDVNTGIVKKDVMGKEHDYSFISCPKEQIIHVVEKICRKALAKGYTMKDIQVLAPIYKGAWGIKQFNVVLQEVFNPKSISKREIVFGEAVFRTGDKVLQLINDPERNVYNGDMGEIAAIFTSDETGGQEQVAVLFDQTEVIYQKSQLGQLTHAYCCSVHKSQGSEFPIVILPFTAAYKRMMKRNLLYTAITRAKKSLILVGDPQIFAEAAGTSDDNFRYSYLIERLNQDYVKDVIDSTG